MKILKTLQIIIVSLMLIVSVFNFCSAAGIGDAFGENLKNTAEKGAGYTAITDSSASTNELIGKIITTALSFVGVIFLILMIYAGYLWMTARGDEAKVTKAQSILTAAVIGLIIVILAYVISTFVLTELSNNVLKETT